MNVFYPAKCSDVRPIYRLRRAFLLPEVDKFDLYWKFSLIAVILNFQQNFEKDSMEIFR